MTVVQMPDGVQVDFGARSPDEIKALILQKFPDIAKPKADYGALSASTRGIGQMLPGGSFLDEAVAGTAAGVIDPIVGLVTGQDQGTFDERYARHLASQRGMRDAAAEQHPTATAVGKVGAIAAIAPKAVAGLAAPALRAATTGERLINAGVGAVKGAAGGAAYSGVQGFGEGEGGFQNRAAEAGRQAAVGAPTGAVLGAGLGALAKVPVAPPVPGAVAAAADRSGVYVPRAIASDSPVVQQAGGAAKSIPLFGTRITDAGKKTVADFTAAKTKIAEGFTGGAAADAASAGKGARDALENWIGPLTKGVIKSHYDAVDALVNPSVTTPLNETARTATQIVTRNRAATLPPGSAVAMIRQAASSPGGLTYEGIKNLRTRVGEMLDTPSLIPGDMSQGELKQIYGSLTKDLRTATENAGGIAARKAFDKANLLNAAVAKRREELMRVLGINPKTPAAPEAVFSAIYRKAGSKSTADIATVNKIRKSMPPDAWDQVASGVVGELGRSDAQGAVSLDKFFTQYNQISDAGKKALFGNKPDLHKALDDLATIAGRGKEVAKWANPSGTAQHVAGASVAVAALNPALWPKIAVGALGAHMLTRALTRPATVRAMTAWGRAWVKFNHVGSLGGPTQPLRQSLQFVSRRFAAEIGLQFGLGADRVRQLADSLSGDTPATANPDANANNR